MFSKKRGGILFSVIIPVYNYGHVLPRAIDSVLQQTGEDCEVLVIDDGSTDNTSEIADGLLRRYSGRFTYIRQTNSGPASVRNRGVKESTGDYLIFLDADDRLRPDALENFRCFLETKSDVGMVFGGHLSIQPDGKRKNRPAHPLSKDRTDNFLSYIRKEFGVSNGAAIMAREVFEKIRYPEHLRNSEDIPVFAQVLALFDCASIPKPVLEVYKHGDSLRNRTDLILNASEGIPEALFNPDILPGELMKYRDEFIARQELSISRALFLGERYSESRRRYIQGIRKQPHLLFDLSHLTKFIRSFFKKDSEDR